MTKPFNPADYLAPAGRKIKLARWPTSVKKIYRSKSDYNRRMDDNVGALQQFQNLLYAHNTYALLIIFQAMDAAGKDGAIKHVMSGVNPQGCQVFSFKQPSAEELDHDFLWRTNKCLPERGRIGIFNRSYYEEVLVVRVHPELLERQHLPNALRRNPGKLWRQRYASIAASEKHLHENGTRILKFFLHISAEEQRRRLLARVADPAKNWKIGEADVRERAYWENYQQAYEKCIQATSAPHAPWYIVPADDKKNARLIVSSAIIAALRGLDMHYPPPPSQSDLQKIRKALEK